MTRASPIRDSAEKKGKILAKVSVLRVRRYRLGKQLHHKCGHG